ncbi:MAG: Nif3-like dinuclear metal center hexameric protein [Bacilli bacterium]|nr:Nif3-like dinuclear metal center hexameric protein [Bacilli bacterium]
MAKKILDLTNYLDDRFPIINASDFDQKCTGFIIGSKNNEIKKVLLALDLTLEVAKQAKEVGANFIITHHPFLFNGLFKINFDNEVGQTIKFMCENNMNLYCVHTALDVARGGVNDALANKLNLCDIEGIEEKDNFLRTGYVPKTTLLDYANFVKERLELGGVRLIGDKDTIIHKIGIVGGSGSNDIYEAKRRGCDCLITGEVRLNRAIEAKQIGLAMIEVNHGVERFVFDDLKKELDDKFVDIDFIVSDINTDPLYFV